MSKKVNKTKAGTINRVSAIIFFIGMAGIISTASYWGYKLIQKENTTPVASELITESMAAGKKYDYAGMSLLRKESVDGNEYSVQYDVSASQIDSYKSYSFRDSEDNELYQCWQKGENSLYDVYLWASEYETWVHTSLEQEPVDINPWYEISNTSGYTVMDETYQWYDTGDECYVLQLLGTADEWEQYYEEVYIRKSDKLLMGIVVVCMNQTDEITHDDVVDTLPTGEDANIEVEQANADIIVQKYSIRYSDEPLSLFDIPEEYMTDEEYMSLVGGNSVGKEEDEDE